MTHAWITANWKTISLVLQLNGWFVANRGLDTVKERSHWPDLWKTFPADKRQLLMCVSQYGLSIDHTVSYSYSTRVDTQTHAHTYKSIIQRFTSANNIGFFTHWLLVYALIVINNYEEFWIHIKHPNIYYDENLCQHKVPTWYFPSHAWLELSYMQPSLQSH